MFELRDFYAYCRANNVDVIAYPKAPSAGTTIRDEGLYAIFLDFTQISSARRMKGICAHEMGHAATGALHKVSSPFETVERSEYRAKRWIAENILTESDFREAFSQGYSEPWELAEYFDMPEQDIKDALSYWTEHREIDFNT